jgi:hypothetical protein
MLGIYATINKVSLTEFSTYFLSLTGFVGSFIYGESIRKSKESSVFLKGENSKRESLTYIIIAIWAIIGIYAIYSKNDILSASTYFAALTPFVGAYIIGETHKAENTTDITDTSDTSQDVTADTPAQQINS